MRTPILLSTPAGPAPGSEPARTIEGATLGGGGRAERRFVAVGASNLTRFALPLLDAARAAAGGAVEAHMALGFGRSFVTPSRMLWRGLPSIDNERLWRALGESPRRPTTAVVMDVGNDLLYGVEVPRILQFVGGVLQRLAAHADELVLAGVALEPPRRVPAWFWRTIRAVLVPSCRLSLTEALARAEELHAGLAALAERHAARFVVPDDAHYGLDPVHFRARHFRTVARTWLGVPPERPTPRPHCDSRLARLGFWLARPAERTWFGRLQTAPQPARSAPDGTTLSLW